MKLNTLEYLLVNNPVRKWVMELIDFREIWEKTDLPPGKKILEIGCGAGYGTRLIKKYFRPKELYALDLDSKAIAAAEKNNKDEKIRYRVGNATQLQYPEDRFDAVITQTTLHHVEDWRKALDEIHRVLRKEGLLVLEDLSKETFQTVAGRHYKRYFKHPYKKMYTQKEAREYLEKQGYEIRYERTHHPLHLIKYFLIIAQKK